MTVRKRTFVTVTLTFVVLIALSNEVSDIDAITYDWAREAPLASPYLWNLRTGRTNRETGEGL